MVAVGPPGNLCARCSHSFSASSVWRFTLTLSNVLACHRGGRRVRENDERLAKDNIVSVLQLSPKGRQDSVEDLSGAWHWEQWTMLLGIEPRSSCWPLSAERTKLRTIQRLFDDDGFLEGFLEQHVPFWVLRTFSRLLL